MAATNLLDMADKLDQADQQDFSKVLAKAKSCTRNRDFACAEQELAKAGKLVTRSEDRKALASARDDLGATKRRVEEEQRERQAAVERAQQRRPDSSDQRSGGSTCFSVDASMACGLSPCPRNQVCVSGGPENKPQECSSHALTVCGSPGHYSWSAKFSSDKYCVGTVTLNGRNVAIRVYDDCRDAGTYSY